MIQKNIRLLNVRSFHETLVPLRSEPLQEATNSALELAFALWRGPRP